ncbi:MAG: hypothetical protein EOM12_09895 [Verrucomicrobiae bacterium]|nr:hypothetical protein [Verrucomicrobiae bacterium]
MTSILGNLGGLFGNTMGMLEIAKNAFRTPGIGLSGRARAMNMDYLSNINGLSNKLLSAGIDSQYSIEAMRKQIFAKRASLPQDRLAPSLRDDYVPPSEDKGTKVDKTV